VPTDAYAELAELAGGFIHEIKNHLSTLGLNLQLLAEDFEEPQSQRERRAQDRVQRLQNECQQLIDVSNDFLRFARVQDLQRVPTNVAAVVEEMVDFFGPTARQANIDIKCYLPSDLPLVPLDREMFKQALLNLMLNSEQAMPEGGELTILVQAKKSELRIYFQDSGPGVPRTIRSKIFEPFFTTRAQGTGLGLAFVERIVLEHGGTISVGSSPSGGAQFQIHLPIEREREMRQGDE